MTKPRADTAVPAPLKALGGWSSAEWFCPSVLHDDDVVGFTLPKLLRGRKQSFRIVERSAPGSGKGQPAAEARLLPKRAGAPGIADIIDAAGADSAAAFRRATFLFEAAPVLYFAKIPLAALKIRAANKLRAALIDSFYRGCTLHIDAAHVIAMFWPAAETEITDYISDAGPPYPMHPDFETASNKSYGRHDADRNNHQTGQRKEDRQRDQEQQKLRQANAKLLYEIAALRTQVDTLRQSQTALGAMESLGLDDARLKSMLRLLHPDKHGNDDAATEAAKWINNLRDLLRKAKT